MKAYDSIKMFCELCRLSNKWGLYISFAWDVEVVDGFDYYQELKKAAPYLDFDTHSQIISEGIGYFLFDTEEECKKYYNLTIGDDGPTDANDYSGPQHVYALTIDTNGKTRNENT